MAVIGLILGGLGTVVGLGGGYYAYTRVGMAQERIKDQNNMRIIGLAMHNQNDSMGKLAGPYTLDNAGEPNTGLSWRVGMLPYIEEAPLYQRFNRRESWDSATNKPLSNTPIRSYTTPFNSGGGSTQTPYRVFYGGGALFNEDGKPVRMWGDVTDGLSNTIMVVHAREQVPWAAPQDFKYSDTTPLPALGHPSAPGGFNVLMADGSVRFVSNTVSERTLRLLITRADGMPIPGDW
jgi:prepilin-type processing-associated H-X9-DG protein